MKKWTVYQVENLVNGRLYIGVHKTEDPNDGYMGSGKLIRFAIEKHGLENFRKEVLLVTEDKAEAFALEKSLVTIDRIESGELYNLKEGGEGGWDWCNRNTDWSKRNKERSQKGREKLNHLLQHDSEWKSRWSSSLSRSLTGRISPLGMLGKNHSIESRQKMSASKKTTSAGSRNSQHGTVWITDGSMAKKILSEESIPDGWRKGRK